MAVVEFSDAVRMRSVMPFGVSGARNSPHFFEPASSSSKQFESAVVLGGGSRRACQVDLRARSVKTRVQFSVVAMATCNGIAVPVRPSFCFVAEVILEDVARFRGALAHRACSGDSGHDGHCRTPDEDLAKSCLGKGVCGKQDLLCNETFGSSSGAMGVDTEILQRQTDPRGSSPSSPDGLFGGSEARVGGGSARTGFRPAAHDDVAIKRDRQTQAEQSLDESRQVAWRDKSLDDTGDQ